MTFRGRPQRMRTCAEQPGRLTTGSTSPQSVPQSSIRQWLNCSSGVLPPGNSTRRPLCSLVVHRLPFWLVENAIKRICNTSRMQFLTSITSLHSLNAVQEAEVLTSAAAAGVPEAVVAAAAAGRRRQAAAAGGGLRPARLPAAVGAAAAACRPSSADLKPSNPPSSDQTLFVQRPDIIKQKRTTPREGQALSPGGRLKPQGE